MEKIKQIKSKLKYLRELTEGVAGIDEAVERILLWYKR